ncbi:MAG: cation:proton antiporter [Planctomycetota bacterium]|jgi:CPA2 family monovalent cation:H+ antiporter-2
MLGWELLLDILIMLGAALLLGTLAEQVRQSAILGYLLAGALVGPNVLGFVSQGEHVGTIAELGVALLLFSIGLEFSFRRLMRLGRVALVGGTLQVLVTMLAGAGISAALGLDVRAALAIGAIVALSSTACVLRLLVGRGAVDSLYGRNALGILLLQDLAVIPLLLLVVVLSAGGTLLEATMALGRTVLLAAALVVVFVIVLNYIVPKLLSIDRLVRNRELPILLAIVLALGSAYAAHAASLSPAIGAFAAGVLLGGSPFATQIRADVGSLRTVLVTLFFASIGMLGNPAWVAGNWHLVVVTVLLIIAGKTLLVWAVVRLIGFTHGIAAATGLCLAQVGEFSFVLAETARGPQPLISDDLFNLIVSVTIVTLFVTPFLVGAAPRAANVVESIRRRWLRGTMAPTELEQVTPHIGRPDIVIIGFGPAGQSVASALYAQHKDHMAVIELNPRTAAVARQFGLPVHLGDAAHREVLEHAGTASARVIAITVPDPSSTRTIIQLCRNLAPEAAIVVRSRYHIRRWELELAGAREVVDEEEQVGLRIAAMARKFLHAEGPESEPEEAQSG